MPSELQPYRPRLYVDILWLVKLWLDRDVNQNGSKLLISIVSDVTVVSDEKWLGPLRSSFSAKMRTIGASSSDAVFAPRSVREMSNIVGTNLSTHRDARLRQGINMLYQSIIIDVNHIAVSVPLDVLMVGLDMGVSDSLPSVFAGLNI